MDEFLTTDEVMVALKISRSTLDRLLASGQLTAQRIGENGSLRFMRCDVQGCLQPRTQQSPVVHGGQLPGRIAGGRGGFKRG
jgi:excisionase family DNA binding protein